MIEMFKEMKAHKKAQQSAKRKRNLAAADPAGWKQFTPFHWRRELLGSNLDYWPSTKRWYWRGKYGNGVVEDFIAAKLAKAERTKDKTENER